MFKRGFSIQMCVLIVRLQYVYLKVTVKTDAPNLGKSTYCVQLAELQVISMIGRVASGSTYLRTLKWLLKKRQNYM